MATKLLLTTGVVYVRSDIDLSLQTVTTARNGIAVTSTDGVILSNSTASTASVTVEQSPRIRLRSNVWNTTVTAVNNTDDWIIESVPVSGATPSGLLKIGSSLNGGAYTFPLTVTSAGVGTFLSAIVLGAAAQTSGAVRLNINEAITSDNGSGGNVSLMYLKSSNSSITFADSGSASTFGSTVQATQFLIAAAAAATSCKTFTKKVTGIADNTATDVLTVTIPNANHAAAVKLTFVSSNGSTDAFESSRVATGHVIVARTSGANAVATAATIDDAAIATVASGATHTLAYNVSAIAGAADASNTFTIQVTIDDLGNLGSNQVVVLADLINAEATGITIA